MEGQPGGEGARAVPPSSFGADLVAFAAGGGRGLRAWVLDPGMGFGESTTWWGGGGRRARPHEGIDLRSYLDASGRRRRLEAGDPVPAPWDGMVAAVVGDFLGASVFIAHRVADRRGWRLHSVLGHLLPHAGLAAGAHVRGGEVVGALAEPSRRGSGLPAHLHLSLAFVDPAVPTAAFGWELMQDRSRTRLLDPSPLAGPAPAP